MDRKTILQHLQLAERHVAEGARHIARQREIVAELADDGRDLVTAEKLLSQFERMQALHVADRDRILAALTAE